MCGTPGTGLSHRSPPYDTEAESPAKSLCALRCSAVATFFRSKSWCALHIIRYVVEVEWQGHRSPGGAVAVLSGDHNQLQSRLKLLHCRGDFGEPLDRARGPQQRVGGQERVVAVAGFDRAPEHFNAGVDLAQLRADFRGDVVVIAAHLDRRGEGFGENLFAGLALALGREHQGARL